MKKIVIASDHAGYGLKEEIKKLLKDKYVFEDVGTFSEESVDYPDFADKAVQLVRQGKIERGILICGSGIGMSIYANKFIDIRCALVWNEELAKLCRLHNDANMIALPGRFMDSKVAMRCVELFMETPFEGGRHQRRLEKIIQYIQQH
jgi:ribose 5-phosphate isomerase B